MGEGGVTDGAAEFEGVGWLRRDMGLKFTLNSKYLEKFRSQSVFEDFSKVQKWLAFLADPTIFLKHQSHKRCG
ncbi:hypothetical protein HC928_19685 [bacterium]|nr:hypothetical protein [bacterium]